MKVTKWTRKMMAAIVAGGALAPGVSRAVNVPLADPSFEAYMVSSAAPPIGGYAYANAYRPTSGWVDDLDSPSFPIRIRLDTSKIPATATGSTTPHTPSIPVLRTRRESPSWKPANRQPGDARPA